MFLCTLCPFVFYQVFPSLFGKRNHFLLLSSLHKLSFVARSENLSFHLFFLHDGYHINHKIIKRCVPNLEKKVFMLCSISSTSSVKLLHVSNKFFDFLFSWVWISFELLYIFLKGLLKETLGNFQKSSIFFYQ